MSNFPSLENRSIKRKDHCPPDVYSQRVGQKEDLMCDDFVRDGFKYNKPVRDEYQSCKDESKFLNAESVWNFFYGVMSRRYNSWNFQDNKKKQTTSVRDCMIPVIDMYKDQVVDWFNELACTKPLQNLGKRVPLFKDKEELLNKLLLSRIPISRAIWFINMSVIQSTAVAENAKKKSRAPQDPTAEWTATLCRMLTRQLELVCFDSQNSKADNVYHEWDYLFNLLLAMYDIDMADHWEVLVWLIKTAESLKKPVSNSSSAQENTDSCKDPGDFALKFILHYLIRFGRRFIESELLTRRILYWCCTVFSDIVYSCTGNPSITNKSSVQAILNEYNNLCSCSLHRNICMSLSGLIIFLTMSCPSAAIWNPIPIETECVYFKGSPLDSIHHSLIGLPMPPGSESTAIRKCLFQVEEQIIQRSRLVESNWCCPSNSLSNGESVKRLVRLLDCLDCHDYHLVREHNPMEKLFNQIFLDVSAHADTAETITTLCEWAVSPYRIGIYRSIVIACLLEQFVKNIQRNSPTYRLLQDTLINFLDAFSANLPPFTGDQAPVGNESMRSLVCLFAELIDREIFDHDNYVRHFIARGAFDTSVHPLASENTVCPSSTGTNLNSSNIGLGVSTPPTILRNTNLLSSSQNTAQHSVKSELSEDNDRCSMDNPDSVRSEAGHIHSLISGSLSSNQNVVRISCGTHSPHLHFLTQFPIPQDDSYAHQQNQRFQLLYGSVRARDRGRIRRLVRDICKLFTKKTYCIDVVQGEVCRRKKSKERDREKESNGNLTNSTTSGSVNNAAGATGQSLTVNPAHRVNDDSRSIDELHEDIRQRFLTLSYYDMECVISQCTPVFVKMLNGSNSNLSSTSASDESSTNTGIQLNQSSLNNAYNQNNVPGSQGGALHNVYGGGLQSHIYMPVPSSIFLFFELIETSLNITCLISTVVDTLEQLQRLFVNPTPFMTLYMSYLCLRAIGILQRYQPVLFTMNDFSIQLFPTLIHQVRLVKEPTQCGPFERCILTYLSDLFTSSFVIRTQFNAMYGKAHLKVSVLFRSVDTTEGIALFDSSFATDLLSTAPTDSLTFQTYAEELRNKSNSRFSFVCKAIVAVCESKTSERMNYLCGLCAELTSQCSELTSEWLGAFHAILSLRTPPHMNDDDAPPRYASLVNMIDLNQINIYDNLSSLIGTLLSRHCMAISDFIRLVICPAMVQGLVNMHQPVEPQLESIISLACHILHRLFTAESTVSSLQTSSNVLTPNPESVASVIPGCSDGTAASPPFLISEPLLLTAALQKVKPEFLVDVLKMLIVHSDKASTDNPSRNHTTESSEDSTGSGDDHSGDDHDDDATDPESEPETQHSSRKRAKTTSRSSAASVKKHKRRKTQGRRNIPAVHFIVQRYLEQNVLPSVSELRTLPLSGLTQLVLREICTAPWVRERFQQMSTDRLIRENVLIDENFSADQARRLLHIIYWPYDLSWTDIASTSGLAGAMFHVLRDLNLWTLRCAQMEFQLLHTQIPFPLQGETLGHLAQRIVQEFQGQAVNWLNESGSGMSADGSLGPVEGLPTFQLDDNDPLWLLPALVSKLPKLLKTQLVKVTSDTLKGIRSFSKYKNDEDKEGVLLQHSVILAHPAFFSLLQVCLLEADPIDALYEQIDYFVQSARAIEDRVPDNLRTRQVVQECLRLRLTLVGQKFSVLQSDVEASTRWAVLLAQIIAYGVTEPESNQSLFYMAFDMLRILIHTLAARTGLDGKPYQNVVKKIRRELAECPPSSGIECIRPLLLLTKSSYTIFVTGQSRQRAGASGATGGSLGGGSGSNMVGKLSGGGKASGSKGSGKANSGLLNSGSHFLSSSGDMPGVSARNHTKKRGYMILGKERLAPWDVQDPSKRTMLLSMYGALRTETLPSRIEEQANRLISHDHFPRMRRAPAFYLTPIYPEVETDDAAPLSQDLVTAADVKSIKIDSDATVPTQASSKGATVVVTDQHSSSSVGLAQETSSSISDLFQERPGNISVSSFGQETYEKKRFCSSVADPINLGDIRKGNVPTRGEREIGFSQLNPNISPNHPVPRQHLPNYSSKPSDMPVGRPKGVSRSSNVPNDSSGMPHAHIMINPQPTHMSDAFPSMSSQQFVEHSIANDANQRACAIDRRPNMPYSLAQEMGSDKVHKPAPKYLDIPVTTHSDYVTTVVPAQAPPKRKRGSGRRGQMNASGERGVSSSQRISNSARNSSTNAALSNISHDRSAAAAAAAASLYPYNADQVGEPNASRGPADSMWVNKQNIYNINSSEMQHPMQPNRGPSHRANLTGLLRNRFLYNSSANSSSNVQQIQQPYGPGFNHPTPQHAAHGFDQSHNARTETMVGGGSFNQAMPLNPHVMDTSSASIRRQLPAGHGMPRTAQYLQQQQQQQSSHIGNQQLYTHSTSSTHHNTTILQSQQNVPNPPPYPVSAQQQQQQHSFRVPSDETFTMFDDPYKRTNIPSGSTMPHTVSLSQAYDTTTRSHSQMMNEPHMMYLNHAAAATGQSDQTLSHGRVVPRQVHPQDPSRPEPGLHPNQQTQNLPHQCSHYSTY